MNETERMKSYEQIESFTEYCFNNPEQRFWQALRNWNMETNPNELFILVSNTSEVSIGDGDINLLEDTFYRE